MHYRLLFVFSILIANSTPAFSSPAPFEESNTQSESYIDSLHSNSKNYMFDEDYHADSNFILNLLGHFSADNPIPLKRFFTSETFLDEPLFNEFVNIIVINKAAQGYDRQTLRFFRNGALVLQTLVSTGREQWEGTSGVGKQPTRKYFSTTGVGYFPPTWLKEMHRSSLWDSDMPWTIFFNGGIAIHQAPENAENKLGTRASGGCVRVSSEVAEKIFRLVESGGIGSVPSMNRDGSFQYNNRGQLIRKKTYRTMVIVQDQVI